MKCNKKLLSLVLCLGLSIFMVSCGNSTYDEPSTSEEEVNYVSTSELSMDYDTYVNDEEYLEITENDYSKVLDAPVTTISLKNDTASYRNIVRMVNKNQDITEDAVKIEEMLNYFNYDEFVEKNDSPFGIYTELGKSPFNEDKYIALIRLKTEDIPTEDLPNSNFVFLIDTSGSMNNADKLPLLKESFQLLVDNLKPSDRVSIVTYAGSSEVVLEDALGREKDKIINALETLSAGGSTAGADGIMTAYEIAERNFIEGGNNRIILATDGDFNVGISSTSELKDLISEKRKSGVYLSILGFGYGNYKDDTMETLAKNGNGNHSYIDSVDSAKKVLVNELGSTLFPVAKDVKAQIEFNPSLVESYRLIGYENSMLKNKDFDDDTKDAGEIGIGTDVIVLFELTLTEDDDTIALKYQAQAQTEETEDEQNNNEFSDEYFEVRIRYKEIDEDESKLLVHPVKIDRFKENNTSDFKFASSVAELGLLLRNSELKGDSSIDNVYNTAKNNLGEDVGGYRKEFVNLVEKIKSNYNYR